MSLTGNWTTEIDCQICFDSFWRRGCDLCPQYCMQVFQAKKMQMEAEAEELRREAEKSLEEEAIRQGKTKEEVHKGVGGGTRLRKDV